LLGHTSDGACQQIRLDYVSSLGYNWCRYVIVCSSCTEKPTIWFGATPWIWSVTNWYHMRMKAGSLPAVFREVTNATLKEHVLECPMIALSKLLALLDVYDDHHDDSTKTSRHTCYRRPPPPPQLDPPPWKLYFLILEWTRGSKLFLFGWLINLGRCCQALKPCSGRNKYLLGLVCCKGSNSD